MFIFKSVIFYLTIAVVAGAEPLIERSVLSMGTTATLSASDGALLQRAIERLGRVEAALSSYDERAEIYRLNRDLHVSLSSDTYAALSLCARYYRESGGAFDVTVGSVTQGAYRFGEAERIPSEALLEAQKVGFGALEFNATDATLQSGYRVDLGGMGKGFGVDAVYGLYREANASQGLIALSGDIRCVATCKVEIENPFEEGIIARFQSVRGALAISTSGTYRRFVNDQNHNHLIDPKTKRSAKTFASITLFSYGSNADIDAYATATSVMEREKAIAFLERMGVGYLIFTHQKERIESGNIKTFVKPYM
ncbi:MAG: FAD:protein FMN transferase [Campylobacterales bacterium]|nr:FAD:protein FMN transferase [Campylobacterales bacterium]